MDAWGVASSVDGWHLSGVFFRFQSEICILPYSNTHLVRILLFSNEKFNSTSNNKILSSVINFILHSKRFDGPFILKKK